MDAGTHKLLESVTHRTLHAFNFGRSSTQASNVLTDLLSRYLTLLSTTCTKYAQHAGRHTLTFQDAIAALNELGVGLGDLSDYYESEGVELGRHAVYSARRIEDLQEFRAHLVDGLRQDREDAVPLVYAPAILVSPNEGDEDEDSEGANEMEEVDSDVEMMMKERDSRSSPHDVDALDSPSIPWQPLRRKENGLPPASPPALPLSPVSNPSSPSRKRARTSSWNPPSHIPDFLPPFPNAGTMNEHNNHSQPLQPLPPKIDKPSTSSMPQALPSSSSSSDYLARVPYSQSSLSSVAEWNLPQEPPSNNSLQKRSNASLPTPQPNQALITAYHHILTHPPPPNSMSANPARHRAAMALLSQIHHASRWEPPDTMFSSVAPGQPRVAPIGPTYPVPIVKPPKGEEPKLPVTLPRPVATVERLSPLVSEQSSRIPELARYILPPNVHQRATKLSHPPVLSRQDKKLYYGLGIPAPWNAGTPVNPSTTPADKGKETNGILANGKSKEPPKPTIPDAMLYATWDYQQKNYNVPLDTRRQRPGAPSGSGLTLSLGAGKPKNKVG